MAYFWLNNCFRFVRKFLLFFSFIKNEYVIVPLSFFLLLLQMPYLSDRQYGLLSHRRLLIKLKNSASITRRLKLGRSLDAHRGCVNTICWNERGSAILSGSDDQHLIVTDPYSTKVLTDVHSGHRENIFSAKFLPETNDRRVVSCSGDGVLFHTDFDRPTNSHTNDGCFTCHGSSTAYEVRVIPHTPNLFFSCSGKYFAEKKE
jgi:nuclear receptor interaction protein